MRNSKSGMNRFKNFKMHLCLRKKDDQENNSFLYNLTGTVKNIITVNSKCLYRNLSNYPLDFDSAITVSVCAYLLVPLPWLIVFCLEQNILHWVIPVIECTILVYCKMKMIKYTSLMYCKMINNFTIYYMNQIHKILTCILFK